jgi:hypothetical protein
VIATSAQESARVREVVARVIAKDRVEKGLPPLTHDEQTHADALAIARPSAALANLVPSPPSRLARCLLCAESVGGILRAWSPRLSSRLHSKPQAQ